MSGRMPQEKAKNNKNVFNKQFISFPQFAAQVPL
jgi:hypothetical protein